MKKDRIPKLLQATLARFIVQNMPLSTFGALTTITDVQITPNLSLAKIYFSFILADKKRDEMDFLKQIEQQKYTIKKYLASELGSRLRILPDIQFHIDHTAQKAIQMEQVLANL